MAATELTEIVRALRDLSKRHQSEMNISRNELQKGKAIAAKYYLAHNNREITLTNDQFSLFIDILKIKD